MGNVATEQPGAALFPSTAGEGQDWLGLSRQAARGIGSAQAELGTVDEYGRQVSVPEPTISAEDANKSYGIPGKLDFSAPVPASVAQSMQEAKVDEIARADAAARAPAGFWPTALRMGVGFVAGALDPLNIAAAFVPVIGEARIAGMLARAGVPGLGEAVLAGVAEDGAAAIPSQAARAAVRAATGAVGGLTFQAPLTALHYGLSRQEQGDYSAMDALGDMMTMGAGFGAAAHVGFGALGDLFHARFASSRAGQAVAADPATGEAAMRASVSQLVSGNPVEVGPIFGAADKTSDVSAGGRGDQNRPPVPISSENVVGQAPIERFRQDAAAIQEAVPAVADGFTRLWRGNRDGEVGTARQFTNDLAGIALPFREAYRGDISYVDVPTAEVGQYENKAGAAPGAEFSLPADLAGSARRVPVQPVATAAERDERGRGAESGILAARSAGGLEPGAGVTPPAPTATPFATPFDKVPKAPTRLNSFLTQKTVQFPGTANETTIPGGVRDSGGELSGIIGGPKGRPGLINNRTGRSFRDALVHAWENGYFPEFPSRGEVPDDDRLLLDRIRQDHAESPVYSMHDQDAFAAHRAALDLNSEIDRLAAQYGIDTKGLTREAFFDRVIDAMSVEEQAAEIESMVSDHQADYERAIAAGRADGREYGNESPRSLEELDSEYRQEKPTTAARDDGAHDGGQKPVAGDAGAGEQGEGEGGDGVGAGRRDGTQEGTSGSGGLDPSGVFDRALDAAHGAPSDDEVAITRMVDAAAKERAPDVEGRIPKALETQIADIHDALARSDAAGLLGDSERAEIEAAQSWVQQAKKYAQAAAQAAVCLARGFA